MKYEELTKMGDGWVTMNGESFRKGSFYVGMLNGYAFESLAANPTEDADTKVDEIISEIDKLPLINAGAFTFFTPYEWLSRGGEGRSLICLVYLKRTPSAITPEVQKKLVERGNTGTALFRTTIKKLLDSPEWFPY